MNGVMILCVINIVKECHNEQDDEQTGTSNNSNQVYTKTYTQATIMPVSNNVAICPLPATTGMAHIIYVSIKDPEINHQQFMEQNKCMKCTETY